MMDLRARQDRCRRPAAPHAHGMCPHPADASTGDGAPSGAPDGTPGGAPLALETRGLAVGHASRALVSDIDLAVRPGELLVLVGPNGSGKTTMLRTIAGQLKPLGGSIKLFGRPLDTIPGTERARTMAALFTDRHKTDLITCQDIVEAGRHPYTGSLGVLSPEDRRCVREAMEATGTWGLRDRDAAHVSDGQRQRVLIARALCQEPKLLVLDEPTSYLDIHSQVGMIQLLRDRARERRMAVVASLHDIGMALRAADRIACIHGGRVIFQGAPDAALSTEMVSRLYGVEPASYDPVSGSVELARPAGEPQVFVIAGGGTGTSTFRALQRRGIPFAAGVLYPGDIDGQLAARLAATAIFAADFEPVSPEAVDRAKEALLACRAVVCLRSSFGAMDARNAELLEAARAAGIPVCGDIGQLDGLV